MYIYIYIYTIYIGYIGYIVKLFYKFENNSPNNVLYFHPEYK